MTELELAWAAGFFDGEGCVILRKSNKTRTIRIAVSQVNPSPILKFKEFFGGHVGEQKRLQETWKPQLKWEQDSKGAAETLEKLLPYLVVKRDVAILAIDFQKTKKRNARLTPEKLALEEEFRSKICHLNHRD